MIVNDKKRGINRAEIKDSLDSELFEKCIKEHDGRGTCVFISHRSTDKKEALEIANFFQDCGIDVYIDVKDQGLQVATQKDDPELIVKHIQDGLSLSTHVLVLISDNTRLSWWVPYEIGYGAKGNKKIASMLLENKEVDGFPDYLKIEKEICSVDDFIKFLLEVKRSSSPYGDLFENNNVKLPDVSAVRRYIKEVKRAN
jgi:hypothetical protein